MRVGIINRGEVAVRIIKSCHELGLKTVLFHSSSDKQTLAYELCDEAFELKGQTPLETYLNIPVIIEALKATKVDLVHPGFGFLSENAYFVTQLENNKINFIGPKATSIDAVGNKIKAIKLAQSAGVPTTPSYVGPTDDAKKLLIEVKKIGYPCMVKAAAGGGGKGMKRVNSDKELLEQVESAKREAQNSFGNNEVFIEKIIEDARHIEVQILCDKFGNNFHFYERDCTVQRRYQKIFEETPSPTLKPDLREKILDCALKIAKAANYTNAGTVEFLVEPGGNFYFMELNTRLQVEHTVSEMLCGVDFIKLQISIALGEKLEFKQKDIMPRGHALEVRIYAENPEQEFLPSTGDILELYLPIGPHRRFDFGYSKGHSVTPYFDPMIGKVITWAPTRMENLKRMHATLSELVIFGIYTNIEFLKSVLTNKKFISGHYNTHFLEEAYASGFNPPQLSQDQNEFAKLAMKNSQLTQSVNAQGLRYQSPWQ
ncbi:MAG: ATP-grasp domain-containing protein [Oligoflexia bacterium]|nr:ATP-grasp domain-containing protein [Oligoflexia bacterium]